MKTKVAKKGKASIYARITTTGQSATSESGKILSAMKIDKMNVKCPLTKAELDLLLKQPTSNERPVCIRDVSSAMGLAFTDVNHLWRKPEEHTFCNGKPTKTKKGVDLWC